MGWHSASNGNEQWLRKELNEDLGLNLSDYGARWYDAAVGRWWSVDPMGEKYYGWSRYNFVLNNPMGNIDPDGRDVILLINAKAPFGSHMGGHSAVLIGTIQMAGCC